MTKPARPSKPRRVTKPTKVEVEELAQVIHAEHARAFSQEYYNLEPVSWTRLDNSGRRTYREIAVAALSWMRAREKGQR